MLHVAQKAGFIEYFAASLGGTIQRRDNRLIKMLPDSALSALLKPWLAFLLSCI